MVREERELQRAFSTKEKYEKILINLDDLKAQESTPDDLFNSMKIEYQQSIGQAIATIDRVKRKLEGDIQSEEVNMQRLNQELQNLNTRFKVGEITADDLQKAEQRVRGRMQRSQTLINELKRLQASQSSADVGVTLMLNQEPAEQFHLSLRRPYCLRWITSFPTFRKLQ